MSSEIKHTSNEEKSLFDAAYRLAIFTILYNIAEGLLCVYFGYADESLTLFGFGVDSFIETISGIGIAHMITRIRKHKDSNRDEFEITALKITGYSFYILVAGLVVTAFYNIYTKHEPTNTLPGVFISLISIVVMWILIREKIKIGKKLNSKSIIADANCAKICMYMSLILLAASGIHALFKIQHIDSVATLIIAYLSYQEGKECFDHAKNKGDCGHHHHS